MKSRSTADVVVRLDASSASRSSSCTSNDIAQVGPVQWGGSSLGADQAIFCLLFSADKVRGMRKVICLLVVALYLSSCGLNYHFCPPGQEHDPSRPFASCRPTTTPGANER
jgi:hypothetical protein